MVSTGGRESDGPDRPGMRHAGAVAGRGGSIGGGVSLPYVRENKCPPGKRVHETPARNARSPPLNARSPPLQPLARWPPGPLALDPSFQAGGLDRLNPPSRQNRPARGLSLP